MRKKKGKDLRKKLTTYSGIAACVLAVAPAAEAAVVYSGPQNLAVNSSTTPLAVDIDGSGSADFRFGTISGVGLLMTGAASGSFVNSSATSPSHFGVARLASNYNINNTPAAPRLWGYYFGILAAAAPYSASYGNFNGGKTGFIGVRFTGDCNPGSFHYGWIRFREMTAVTGTIIDWAYEDTCNTAIRAGAGIPAQTPAPVPTVNEWGAIGMAGLLGGAAIKRLRRKKTEQE